MDVDTGWNADRVSVHDSQFDANVKIHSEAVFAPKRMTLENVHVRLALALETGDGDDQIRLRCVSSGSLAIATHDGADRVDLDWVTTEHLQIALGLGNDRLSVEPPA
jgi:hypothetical protein